MSYFYPFEVVNHGSETQLQVGTNFNKITQWIKGYMLIPVTGTKDLFSFRDRNNFIVFNKTVYM